jgi:hypothetical protein
MKGKLLSRFDSENLRKAMIYLAISILMIIASLFIGLAKDSSFAAILFFTGCALFFYGALRPWGRPVYYLVLDVVSVVVFLILVFTGIDYLVKYYNHGHEAEDVSMTLAGVCIAAFFARILARSVFENKIKCPSGILFFKLRHYLKSRLN